LCRCGFLYWIHDCIFHAAQVKCCFSSRSLHQPIRYFCYGILTSPSAIDLYHYYRKLSLKFNSRGTIR
jgi:hypothetical protein